jgi:hypothetical protein
MNAVAKRTTVHPAVDAIRRRDSGAISRRRGGGAASNAAASRPAAVEVEFIGRTDR